jgi:flagella basal body P-ring formation protein FlgA
MLGVIAPANLLAYSVYLENQVEVPPGAVRLGDIARIEGDTGGIGDKLLFRELREPRYVKASELRESLSVGAPESPDRVYGAGTWIIPLGRELDAAELELMLREQLAAIPGGAELHEDTVLRIAPNTRIRVPAGGVRLIFRLPARASSLTAGKRILPLDVLPASETGRRTVFARHQLQVGILKKKRVAIATRDLPIGHRLGPGDYRFEVREFDNVEARFAEGDLSKRRVMSNIPGGVILTTSNVQVMPAVRRGQSLSLVYQRPGMVFRVRSVAMRDGEIGEQIPVRVLFPASGGRSSSTSDASRILNVTIVAEDSVVFENNVAHN